jgi:hypothetical protein
MWTGRTLPIIVISWICVFAAAICSAAPQQIADSAVPRRSAVVTATTSEITVDGLLEESAWTSAPDIGNLIQREPRTGETPSEKTQVRLLHDANNLYIAVMCYDSEPDKVIGTQMERDADLSRSDDRITIVLDTFRDQRNAFFFSTNPAGALVDGLVFANGQSNNDWDTIWTVRTKRTDQGWSAEFAIPFKSLNFPSGRSVWGFNIARNIHRKLEEDRWSGALLQTQFFSVSEAGEITNLDGLTQGLGVNIRPFTAGRWLHTDADQHNAFTGKPGLDMFYNLTPSLKLTATANTDFGETEADARQINLSRFSLLFPEKRSFFLEDAGVFNFAGTNMRPPAGIPSAGADLFPFFSRQIGLLSGQEVPIDFGVKLTGKAGRTELGVIDVRTRDISTVPDKNFFVGRVKRNILQQSHIGAIFTSGNPALQRSSNTFGADIRLATSRFLGGKQNFAVSGYAVRSKNEGVSNEDSSFGFEAQFPNDKYDAQFSLRDIQQNFRPGLGFVQRRNVRLLRAGASYNPRPKNFLGVQQMIHDLYYTQFTRLDTGEVESWELQIQPFDWHFNSGDALHAMFDIIPTYERLSTPFTIFKGVVLPPGEYKFTRFRGNWATAQKRKVNGTFMWFFGPYWSGRGNTIQTSISYKLPPRLNVSFSTNQTFARLPQGNFVARIVSTQINITASPFLSVSNLVQYDNQSRNLAWQSRVRWILQPGNDLFFVFNQGWIQDPAGGYQFTAQDSKVSAKLQYTFRF